MALQGPPDDLLGMTETIGGRRVNPRDTGLDGTTDGGESLLIIAQRPGTPGPGAARLPGTDPDPC